MTRHLLAGIPRKDREMVISELKMEYGADKEFGPNMILIHWVAWKIQQKAPKS